MATVDYGLLAAQAAKGLEPLPAIDYNAEITNAEYRPSSNDNPMYRIEFTIVDGPHKNRKVFTNFTLKLENPNSVGYFFGKMAALGLDAAFFAGLPEANKEALICQTLLGRRAVITVGPGKPYQGRVRDEVKNIKPATVPATTAPPEVAVAAPAVAVAAPAVATAVATGPPDLPPGL
jgi:hypothetical protein